MTVDNAAPTYHVAMFEGPLDLLLSLVAKNKIDIYDIPISLLCDQYLQYIDAAQKEDLELSADFLVMASELMLIKSRMLLPRPEAEEEDPRAALAAAMLEYQRMKLAIGELSTMYDKYSGRFIKDTDEIPADNSFTRNYDVDILGKIYRRVMSEVHVTDADSYKRVQPLISEKAVSVTEKIFELTQYLKANKSIGVLRYLRSANTKNELFAMFMGLLELLREQQIHFCGIDDDASGVLELEDGLTIEMA